MKLSINEVMAIRKEWEKRKLSDYFSRYWKKEPASKIAEIWPYRNYGLTKEQALNLMDSICKGPERHREIKPIPVKRMLRHALPCSDAMLQNCPEYVAVNNNRDRRLRWKQAEPTVERIPGKVKVRIHEEQAEYAKSCQWFHIYRNHIITYQSYVAFSKRRMVWVFMGKVRKFRLPDGYIFADDKNGVKIMSVKNNEYDYHFSGSDLVHGHAIMRMIHKLKENAKIRKSNQKNKEKMEREKEKSLWKTVKYLEKKKRMITMMDSLRSGNCEAGTRVFARNHNLSVVGVRANLLYRVYKRVNDVYLKHRIVNTILKAAE